MPENAVTPIARRLIDPAPLANTIGSIPRMNVSAVITTALKRSDAPLSAASIAVAILDLGAVRETDLEYLA
jgi:hypothetical protein